MASVQIESATLLDQARAGSGSCLGRLLDGYRVYLLRVAGQEMDHRLQSKISPSDIVQESLLLATREFERFRGSTQAEFRMWLRRILIRQLIDGLRRFVEADKRNVALEVSGNESILRHSYDRRDSPSHRVGLQEEALALLEAIESLPVELREIVQARYLEGSTFPQIAAEQSIPVTTCRRRWLEAVELIRQRMGG